MNMKFILSAVILSSIGYSAHAQELQTLTVEKLKNEVLGISERFELAIVPDASQLRLADPKNPKLETILMCDHYALNENGEIVKFKSDVQFVPLERVPLIRFETDGYFGEPNLAFTKDSLEGTIRKKGWPTGSTVQVRALDKEVIIRATMPEQMGAMNLMAGDQRLAGGAIRYLSCSKTIR